MELSRGMIETAAAAIFLLNDGKITFSNHVMEEITGYSAQELEGMSPLELIHPEYRKEAQTDDHYTTGARTGTPSEFRIIRKDLETNWVTERLTVISHKGKDHVLGNWLDITEWKIAQELSRYHAQQTELLLKVGATAGQTLNLRDIVENFMDSITQLLHDRPVAFFLLTKDSNNLELVSHRQFSDDFVKRMSHIKVGKGFIGRVALTGLSLVLSPTYYDPRFDPAILERDNLWSLCSVPVFAREQIKGVICLGSRDQRHSLEEETQLFELISSQIGIAIDHALLYEKTVEMAFTDGLTGLYNRRYLFEELNREVSRASRNNSPFSIINMDVDNFKTINDRFGHDQGDRMLKEFSDILKKFSRKSDIAARMGGDEFILLTSDCDYQQATAIAQRILTDANSQRIDLKSEKVNLHASIGIAGYPTHGATIDEILSKSDKAMYDAKNAGKNQIKVAAV
jgi:diguanylate cyclase (GGDEF)-like protein/PAS domain S-box-containing protein